MKVKVTACVLLLCVLLGIGVPCGAAEEKPLTITSAVLMNEYQVIITFSEPVVFNRNGDSTGPMASVRLVDDNYELQRHDNGQVLQWVGILDYVDDKHDRLLFTVTASTLKIESLRDVFERNGVLKAYDKLKVTFCLEEVKFTAGGVDRFLENVTNENGTVRLNANYYTGVDRLFVPLTMALDENADLSARETIFRGRRDMDVTVGTSSKEG
ncbi:MAG: hypothetical protein E7618_04600 [Ruminococcaceae bacterium]|nr:hypothetical protein [Oscillospiraceae bacterium]